MHAENLINEIHDFWFHEAGAEKWWKKDAAFDEVVRQRFGTLVEEAAAGALDSWAESSRGALALILLLDQFPRNIYRNTPKAFAADQKAKNLTLLTLGNDYLENMSEDEHCFFILPLEHSEDLSDQELCVSLFETLGNEKYLQYAIAHKAVIEKFGRFPHRNAILGRNNTPEEEEYLKDPEAGF
jgi:uncharacterized protein (DUF924 family)